MVPLIPEEVNPAPTFDDFWLLVVKRARKFETKREWDRLDPAEQLAAIIGAAQWRSVWLAKEWEFIVDPCRWVKYRRWEDELPQEFTRTHASHVPAAPSKPTERTEMPENVRALIAKLRGKA